VDAPVLAPYSGGGHYLTRWTNHLGTPADIDADYVFIRAESDTDHHQVILRTRNRGDITGVALLGVIFVGGAAAVVFAVRRRQAK
ncbi:MAG: DUF2330 domain-containing protein, partial [Mycobacterium sp.]